MSEDHRNNDCTCWGDHNGMAVNPNCIVHGDNRREDRQRHFVGGHHCGLMPDELERLAILNEEFSEVQKIVSKIIRHGYDSFNPDGDPSRSNRDLLEEELGHAMHAVEMLCRNEDVDRSEVAEYQAQRSMSIQKYLHHQEGEV